MNKTSKVGLWAMVFSVVAGALAVFAIGPRKIQEKVSALRGKSEAEKIEIDVP